MINLIPDEYRDRVINRMQTAPVDVRALAADFNIRIVEDFIQGSGFLLKKAEGYTIHINMFETNERQNFTIAHELAHFFLHGRLLSTGEVLTRGSRDDYEFSEEREANQLAAAILMPYELMKRAAERDDINTVEDLAAAFGVSVPAMNIRLDIVSTDGQVPS